MQVYERQQIEKTKSGIKNASTSYYCVQYGLYVNRQTVLHKLAFLAERLPIDYLFTWTPSWSPSSPAIATYEVRIDCQFLTVTNQ